MRLIVQIPCFNEEHTLPATLADLPREVDGFDSVLWQVIDDGSTDATADVAHRHGADIVLRLNGHQGLARAFIAGFESALAHGAAVIVNTDADNQYDGRDIPALAAPIVEGRADMVIGARPIQSIQHFSPAKRALQRLGSAVIRSLSGTRVEDAPSGFRALSRDAAMRLSAFTGFSYTMETLIQAGQQNLRVVSVPIRVNPPTRESRLARSTTRYVLRSTLAILSAYIIYRPVRIFGLAAALLLTPAALLAARYLWLMAIGEGRGHVQSVIAAATLAICGVFMLALGIVAHLLAINRRLLEDARYRARSASTTVVQSEPNGASRRNNPQVVIPIRAERRKPSDELSDPPRSGATTPAQGVSRRQS